MSFLLSNEHREFLGLDPLEQSWDKIPFPGDFSRPDSWLFFERDTLKRQIISNPDSYREFQFSEETRERQFLLPKTKRGKEKKLTPSVLEKRQPQGVYFSWYKGGYRISSFQTQTDFHRFDHSISSIENWTERFVSQCTEADKSEVQNFAKAKRKHVKFGEGDFFAFKLDHQYYGFGRILHNISEFRVEHELEKSHGLFKLMGKPVLVKVYLHKSTSLEVNLDDIKACPSFPSEYVFDNHLYYGQNPIIGSHLLGKSEIEFPISYGRSIGADSNTVFLQWGLINEELSLEKFSKYLEGENTFVEESNPNRRIVSPFRKDSIGFSLSVDKEILEKCLKSNSIASYWNQKVFRRDYDLRNPYNESIRSSIFKKFGLRPSLSYFENLNQPKNAGFKSWFRRR